MKVEFKIIKHKFDWKAAIVWAVILVSAYIVFK